MPKRLINEVNELENDIASYQKWMTVYERNSNLITSRLEDAKANFWKNPGHKPFNLRDRFKEQGG